MRPRDASRSVRSPVEAGSIEYSAVSQPRPLPYIHRGTDSWTEAVQSTIVFPARMSACPAGFSTKFASADLNVPAYAAHMKTLGLKTPVPLPYLAVVTVANRQPRKFLWGLKVTDPATAVGALDKRLGLRPADVPPPGAAAATQDTSREALAEMLLRIEGMSR